MSATYTGRYQLYTADAFIGRNGNGTTVNTVNSYDPALFTVLAHIHLCTVAKVVRVCHIASGIIVTGAWRARICVYLAVIAAVSFRAVTGISGHFIYTSGAIQTRVAVTFFNFRLTCLPLKARKANTVEIIGEIHTLASIFALAIAIVNIIVTVLAAPAQLAITLIVPE